MSTRFALSSSRITNRHKATRLVFQITRERYSVKFCKKVVRKPLVRIDTVEKLVKHTKLTPAVYAANNDLHLLGYIHH